MRGSPGEGDIGGLAPQGTRASDVGAAEIWHRYGDDDVLRDVSIEVEHGELVTLLGPSGSGKSTLLRIIGGLEHPRQGRIAIGGEDVTALPAEDREIGFVFQNYALFPHMTVAENVAFPLRMRKVPRREARNRAAAVLEIVGLTGMEGRRPSELSGGQQQRVAVARALVFEPRVLLLDEPFGALDRRLREQLGLEVRRVQRELGITTIFVTHDQDEAFTMSTRIAVMGEGEILQVDAPTAIYKNPARLEVARYLGHLNEFPVTIGEAEGSSMIMEGPSGLRLTVPADDFALSPRARLVCGVRPEHVRIEPAGTPGAARGVVQAAIFSGDAVRAQVVLEDGTELLAILPHDGPAVADQDAVSIGIQPGSAMLFAGAGGSRIGGPVSVLSEA